MNLNSKKDSKGEYFEQKALDKKYDDSNIEKCEDWKTKNSIISKTIEGFIVAQFFLYICNRYL